MHMNRQGELEMLCPDSKRRGGRLTQITERIWGLMPGGQPAGLGGGVCAECATEKKKTTLSTFSPNLAK